MTAKGSVRVPRKGENIYRRKDGRWEARYIHHYEKGKAKYRSVYGATYTEAKEKRQTILSCTDYMRVSGAKRLARFEEIAARWLQSRIKEVKESTFTRYIRTIEKQFYPAFYSCSLIKIGPDDIDKLFDSMKKVLSNKTLSDRICIFKSIWKYGQENGYPCCPYQFPKKKCNRTESVTIIPPATRKKIEEALLKSNNLVSLGIVFTLFTGVRIGEMCGLQWGDIDFENGFATINRTVERIADLDVSTKRKTKVIISEPKTDKSRRIIPLPSFLLDYIERFRLGNDRFILTGSKKHTEPHTYYTRYKTFLRRNDIGDYTYHVLRHTFATDCVEKGFDIKSLSEILGHSDVSTTMNLYVHPTLQMKKRQMDMLSPLSYSPSK